MAHDLEKKWRSQDVRLKENADFSSLLLNDRILKGLTDAGFKKPSPIQLEAIPLGLFGKDLLVQAKSGTGKTLVFVTIALQMLRSRLFRPQILVLAPTREIATQIESVVKLVGSAFPKLICHSFIGGLSVRDDTEKAVTCQFVVGSPGRIKQLITMKALPTNSIRLLVFDEADQLFHKTFKDDIDAIFKSLPEVKQVIATSATYPPSILKLISQYLSDPSVVCLNAKELALLGIVHYAKVVKFLPMPLMLYNNKLAALEEILKSIKFSQCLVFCNGIHRVEVLYRDIKKWGFSATYISSKKEQCDRLRAIDKLKHFKCKVLVSSDLTARGIDAENVDLVINFDLALNTETYMHRVGRAGRYGAIGVAFTIIDENEVDNLKKIEDEGSFKCYKLPDPVPRDLILNPSCLEYVIPDSGTDELEKKEFTCNDVAKEKLQTEKLKDIVIEENGIVNGTDISHNEVNSLERNVVKTVSKKEKLNKTDKLSSKDDNCVMNTLEAYDLIKKEGNVSNKNSEAEKLSTKLTEQMTNDESGEAIVNALEAHNLNIREESICNGLPTTELTEQITANKNGEAPIELEAYDLEIKDESVCNENTEPKITEQIINDENGAATALPTKEKEIENENFSADGGDISDCVLVKSVTESPKVYKSHSNITKVKDNQPNGSNEDNLENIKNVKELKIVDISVLSENKAADGSAKDNIYVEHLNALNHVIKTFINKYEMDESIKSVASDKVIKEEKISGDSSENKISDVMIHNLTLQKNNYFYNVFRKFNDEKNISEVTSSENKLYENLDDSSKLFQDDVSEQEKCALNIANELKNLTEEDSLKDLETEGTEKCLGKPNYESTPQTSEKNKISDNVCESKTVLERKVVLFSSHYSDESKSSDTSSDLDSEISYKAGSLEKQHSDKSESDDTRSDTHSDSKVRNKVSSLVRQQSSSEDSESISDKDSSDESEKMRSNDEVSSASSVSSSSPSSSSSSESICSTGNARHDMLDTGRRNPSLVMNSSENLIDIREGDTRHVRDLRYQGHYNTRFHHSNSQSRYHGNSRNPHSSRFSGSRQQMHENSYLNGHRNEQEHLACPRHHSLKCFLPSAHRCHPNTIQHTCSHRQLCSQWYDEFYRQWQQIQNMLH